MLPIPVRSRNRDERSSGASISSMPWPATRTVTFTSQGTNQPAFSSPLWNKQGWPGGKDRVDQGGDPRERVPVNYKGFSYLNKCTQLVLARKLPFPFVVILAEAGIQDAAGPVVPLT